MPGLKPIWRPRLPAGHQQYSDPIAAAYAKYSLAQIDERQGKLADAMNFTKTLPGPIPTALWASEAGMHAMELRTKQPPPTSSAAPLTPKP